MSDYLAELVLRGHPNAVAARISTAEGRKEINAKNAVSVHSLS